ncbi:transglutaminase family protein [Radicibacter daui]|uniref:transglutaminase family protein n=1 Tax=Radicibacter daui TaxID=3064829 RepID=UPI004046D34A
MTWLTVRHSTHYSYYQPVDLGLHRLMLRPRESREIKLGSFELYTNPAAQVRWAQDVFGNSVATASFAGMTDNLVIETVASLRLDTAAWPVFDIADDAVLYPFRYADDDWRDLGALTLQNYPDPAGQLRSWAHGFVAGNPTNTLSLLKDLNAGVSQWICYQSREDEGTQSPTQTLNRGWGACRDLAVLFVEAARSLGFGARIISGYLYNPQGLLNGTLAGGSTHAWAEVFVPGAGWISFDPTNGGVGGHNLIPLAVGRDIAQVMPVGGSFIGLTGTFREMTVEILMST